MLINQIISLGLQGLLIIVTASVLFLCTFLFIESIAAALPISFRITAGSEHDSKLGRPPRIAVLVPAHNEEIGLEATLSALQPQVSQADRLVVIADNCTDSTAAIAHSMGVTVIERQDQTRVGKGYALDYGLQSLAVDPPEIVLFVDADCIVHAGAISQLVRQTLATGRPAQSTYLMELPPTPDLKATVAALGFMVKNLVRPLGLAKLGFPCLLTGTGMAFPWNALCSVNLASNHLVEDMKLSLDLAIANYPPLYCPGARVTGCLPQQESAALSQRTRWEHGHLQSILAYAAPLFKVGIQKRQLDILVLALEVCVPPLSLFVLIWLCLAVGTLMVGVLQGFWLPVVLEGVSGLLLMAAILISWASFGRSQISLRELSAIPLYVLWKVPLYLKFLIKPQNTWIRTDRDPKAPSGPIIPQTTHSVSLDDEDDKAVVDGS
jgi:cellulose synthase/poly-beta-1,6-N-acetylglucosamine synthase-like glycosyltransferase